MEFTTKGNNAKVVLNPAGLDEAFKLKSLVEKSLIKQNINIFEILDKGEISFEDLVQLAMVVDSDIDVFNACFECMKKCTYKDVRITKELFEDESARGDLYEILFYCLKVNVYPFFKHLLSSFGINSPKGGTGDVLKSI